MIVIGFHNFGKISSTVRRIDLSSPGRGFCPRRCSGTLFSCRCNNGRRIGGGCCLKSGIQSGSSSLFPLYQSIISAIKSFLHSSQIPSVICLSSRGSFSLIKIGIGLCHMHRTINLAPLSGLENPRSLTPRKTPGPVYSGLQEPWFKSLFIPFSVSRRRTFSRISLFFSSELIR